MSLKVLNREDLKPKIAVIVGTRPGIIKFSPVIKEIEKRNLNFFIVHTGQHYSYYMDRSFFRDLNLPSPKYKNDTVQKCVLHGEQTAEMLRKVERALINEKPKIVIVGGDANTNLAGALATRKLGIKLAHMEAGLRSNDWKMPEEHNRVIIDHISDILFAPTIATKRNLIEDNVKGQIYITGNTIVEAVRNNVLIAEKKSNILTKLSIVSKKYFLITIHREENVDCVDRLKNLIICIDRIIQKYNKPVIFPIHPRTTKMFKYFGLENELFNTRNLKVIEALSYLDFLKLLFNSKMVLTDSGGIQEESCILNIPCITLRNNTERPETIDAGGNIIASTLPDKVLDAVQQFLEVKKNMTWKQPFGEQASKSIVDILFKEIK